MKNSSNRQLEKLVLGTVQFGLDYGINNQGGKPSSCIVNKILDCAWDNGIRYLDTAEVYGDSHDRIGKYHAESPNKFKVITKFNSKKINHGTITKNIESNLSVLRVDRLHSYMFHSFGDFKKYNSLFSCEFNKLKEKGTIRKIGVSLYTNEEISRVLDCDQIDIIQAPFNLLDNSNKRENIFVRAKENKKEIHVRSIFLQGLFFKSTNKISEKLRPLVKYLKQIQEMTHEINISQLCLNYALSKKYIDKVLLGVDSTVQLNNNIKLLSQKLDTSLIEIIDKINVEENKLLNPVNWS